MTQIRNGRVEGQIPFEEEAGGFPLLGDHREAVRHGVFRTLKVHQTSFIVNAARRTGSDAEHGLQQLGPAGADQTVETENFALAYVKGNIFEVGSKLCGKMLYGQHDIPRGVVHGGKTVCQRTAHHVSDQLVHIRFFGLGGDHHFTVSQDRNLVADFKDLIHLMRDVDQGNALRLEIAHHFKEFLHLSDGEGRGGLIQYDQLRVIGNRLGDLHHLTRRNRHGLHGCGQIDGHIQFSKKLCRLIFHAGFVDNSERGFRVAPQKQVVQHIAFQALVQFLMDHGDSVFQRVLRAGKVDLFSIQTDGSFILLIGAEEAFHHG